MTRFDLITIFPDFFHGPLDYGIIRRAKEAGLVEIGIHDLRAHTRDRHKTVDDRPFGGGEGMVLKPEPIFDCVEALGISFREARLLSHSNRTRGTAAGKQDSSPVQNRSVILSAGSPGLQPGIREAKKKDPYPKHITARETVILLSASGQLFDQKMASDLAQLERIVLICGRYEGVDERVSEALADREVSVGNFVLSGGELAAAIIVDAVTRLIPGALGNEASAHQESFTASAAILASGDAPSSTCGSGGLLDYPHYTRPAGFRGMDVPEILSSGNHDVIRKWRRHKALEKTLRNRPDLLESAELTEDDRKILKSLNQ